MSPKLDRFAGSPSAPGDAAAGRPQAVKCAKCGASIAAPGLCPACAPRVAARPPDATLVLSETGPSSGAGSHASPPVGATPTRLGWLAVLGSIGRKRKGTVIALEGPVAVVSRVPKPNDGAIEGQGIVFEDDFISFGHLRLARAGDGYELEVRQKGSSTAQNPAYVNKKEVRAGSRVLLKNGDRIEVGATWLEFRTLLVP